MEDREFLVYAVQDSENRRPCVHAADFFLSDFGCARDMAIRKAEREKKPYYVIEVVMVCNTVAVVDPPKE